MRFGMVLFLVAVLLLCGCTGDGVPEAARLDMAAYDQPASSTLPPLDKLDMLRSSSDLVETLVGGKFTLSRSPGAQEQGSALLLDATATGPGLGALPEWAIYGFDAGSSSLDSLQLQFDSAPGSSAYIGLGDFAAGRWEWHGPYSSMKTLLVDDSKYSSPGGTLYCAVVSSQGHSNTVSALSVRTINPNNIAPTADLQANTLQGDATLSVDFDASGSEDPDGSIIEYAWDFDGDGLYEGFGDEPEANHVFTAPGVFIVKLRVSDEHFARATDTLQITVSVDGNLSPSAQFSSDVDTGTAPLIVNLDAFMSDDPDGAIVRFDWDLDGDSVFELYDAGPALEHTFTTAGIHDVHLRVTDDKGAQDIALDSIEVFAANLPPLAVLQLLPDDVQKGDEVNLDAALSGDADGTITLYEWDTDGNGSFETNSGTESLITITANTAGPFTLGLRVTDDDGAIATDSALLHVHGFNATTPDSAGDTGGHASLAVVNGKPAISYFDDGNDDLRYIRAMDADGTVWAAGQTLDSAGSTGWYPSLAVVNGSPAVSYWDSTSLDLRYVRAADADGTAWAAPQTLDSASLTGLEPSLAVVNGQPAVSYWDFSNGDLRYVRATDAAGTSWGAPQTLDSAGITGNSSSLAVVNGKPAISYFDDGNDDLRYIRASDANGTTWGTALTLDSAGATGWYPSLAVVNGSPAVSYWDSTNLDLRYVRAADADGTAWAEPQTLDSAGNTGQFPSLAVVNGKPAISFYQGTNLDLLYIRARDADGTAWATPQTLDSAGDTGLSPSLAVVNGKPAIGYQDFTNADLRFAIGF